MIAPRPADPYQGFAAESFTTLERRLVVRSDSADVLDYVRNVYRRVRVEAPALPDEAFDTGVILADAPAGDPWLAFNGEPVPYQGEAPSTPFRLGFYGSSKLFRLSFRQNPRWRSLYAAALRIGDGAVIVAAHSGIGKTTLALGLVGLGAGFYGDEFVFVRKEDAMVRGLPRTLMIRERTLPIVDNKRLTEVCAASEPRKTQHGDRIWDGIDVADVFGEKVYAEPAPLSAVVLLERGDDPGVSTERIPSALAAVECCKRFNLDLNGFDRLTEVATMLADTRCYSVKSASPRKTAETVMSLLG